MTPYTYPSVPFGKRIIHSAVFSCAIWITFFLSSGLSARAQHPKRLPDSLSTSIEVLSSKLEEPETALPLRDPGGQMTEEARAANDSAQNEEEDSLSGSGLEKAVLRTIPDSAIARFKKEKDFAYANDLSYWAKEKSGDPGNDSRVLDFLARLLTSAGFRYFIYCLLGSILLFAIYKIVKENNLQLFLRNPPKTISDGEDETELTVEDLEEKLQQALNAGNYRLGVRYLFLKTLSLLDARGIIHLHAQTMNHEYLRQMKGNTGEADFQYLTRVYEHVWYGGFSINSEQFARLNNNFQHFYQSMNSGTN